MAPRLRVGYSDFISRKMNDIFLYFKSFGLNTGLTQTSVRQAPGVPSVGRYSGWGLQLTTHLNLIRRLRKVEDVLAFVST